MPALNEESYIADAIQSILPRTVEVEYELLIVDGGSTDCTCSIARELAKANTRIRLIFNERRTQAAAMNLASRVADPRAHYLVRADCHSRYPENFVIRCLNTLGTRRVASVVVSMRTLGRTCLQKAIAAAQNSVLGNGGSAHRTPGRSGYVDHGHHAAFERRVFADLGGYDESFAYNEDAEFDTRLMRSGHLIYLDDVSVDYFPRSDLKSLIRQYYNFGWGRANTVLKHRPRLKLRQLIPVLVVLGLAAAMPLSFLSRTFLIPVALYVGLSIAWGCAIAVRGRELCLVASGLTAVVMHVSWGVGFLSRLPHGRSVGAPSALQPLPGPLRRKA